MKYNENRESYPGKDLLGVERDYANQVQPNGNNTGFVVNIEKMKIEMKRANNGITKHKMRKLRKRTLRACKLRMRKPRQRLPRIVISELRLVHVC